MSNVNIAIMGAGGRMGGALIRAISEIEGASLSAAIEQSGSPLIGKDSGVQSALPENGVLFSDDVDAALEASDCIVDFSVPAVSVYLAKKVGEFNCAHVIGTTGCTPEQEAEIVAAGKTGTVLKSGNMSLGVNLLAALVERAAASLPSDAFDIEVLEMHHKHKVDAPSGTALLLGEAAAKSRDIDFQEKSVRVRDGITGEREDGTIGFATLRGGSVVGDHSVIFAGNGERIELNHIAQDRSLFANGAIRAALWTKGKPAGFYTMRDVLEL